MQEASFNGLFKAILYIFAFYYIFKFLARLFLPVIVKKVAQKAEEQFKQQYQNQQQTENPISTANSAKPKETKKVGEYIDYEEVDWVGVIKDVRKQLAGGDRAVAANGVETDPHGLGGQEHRIRLGLQGHEFGLHNLCKTSAILLRDILH